MSERISDEQLLTIHGAGAAWCSEALFDLLLRELQERRAADAEQARSAEEAWAEAWKSREGSLLGLRGIFREPEYHAWFLAGYAAGARGRGEK